MCKFKVPCTSCFREIDIEISVKENGFIKISMHDNGMDITIVGENLEDAINEWNGVIKGK